jgi:hypothetical protein
MRHPEGQRAWRRNQSKEHKADTPPLSEEQSGEALVVIEGDEDEMTHALSAGKSSDR